MNHLRLRRFAAIAVAGAFITVADAEPVNYVIDSSHTFPSFEADHFAGMSVWRGKVNHTEGTVVFDREAETGTVEATFDMATLDFGLDRMNQEAYDKILHVAEFPTATYTGTLTNFVDGAPTAVEGTLTMHGVSRPVNLEVTSFRCQPHWRTQIEVCGAGATATFDRSEFGLVRDLNLGFYPEVKLLISIEAQRVD
ncbi:MAG: YceI family protein [Gammaproteobacteria bacterium]|nr:YceI family protein [Gammaproteobacteria bacterium]